MRLALGLWIAVAAAVAVRTLHRPEKHTVFPILAAGAVHWWTDQPLCARYEPLDYFRYPPPLAVALTPFAWLGLRAGGILWVWANLAVYFLGLRRCLRDVLPRHLAEREAAFLILSGVGALSGIWNAQSNALLNYCGIDARLIEFTVDRNPLKVGTWTPGTHIPVLPVAALLERQPDCVLILPWNLADEIMRQQQTFRQRGGRFILPIPEPRIV